MTRPSTPVAAWGHRLSDAVRAALRSGDGAEARRLALEGDGETRDLAREYALMVRGLGMTLRVLLCLLAEHIETAGRADAADALARHLARLREGLRDPAAREPALPEQMATAVQAIAATDAAIRAFEGRFGRNQAERARGIVDAIGAGDTARALAGLEAKERAYLGAHDAMIRFMADSFAWVLRYHGPDGLLRFHLETAERQRAGFEKWESLPAADFARITAFLLKLHMGRVRVREDPVKYTVEQTPCGSGGRLRLAGAYAGSDALPFVESRGPLTFGGADLPVYCSHCAIWNGLATLQWFGRAQWVFDRPARADGGCTLHIYKRREDIPAEYANRLGYRDEGG